MSDPVGVDLFGIRELTNFFTFQGYLDHVTVLIGVAVKGRAVGGVIHQPYYNAQSSHVGRTIWGIVGLGQLIFRANQIISLEQLMKPH